VSVLRNIESRLGALVEGVFGRAFRSSVQPVEIAEKLAREMEENQVVSVSRVYAPNLYRVYLSPEDRKQFESYEEALRKELSDYLLEHARNEGLSLTSRPRVEFLTDERLSVGEFGIQAQLLSIGVDDAGESVPRPAEFGETMVYSPERAARPLAPHVPAAQTRALLIVDGKRIVLGDRTVIGRSRECDVVVPDPNASRRHAEVRREGNGWVVRDLGSTNGTLVNGRRVAQAPLRHGDRLTVGLTEVVFEVE